MSELRVNTQVIGYTGIESRSWMVLYSDPRNDPSMVTVYVQYCTTLCAKRRLSFAKRVKEGFYRLQKICK